MYVYTEVYKYSSRKENVCQDMEKDQEGKWEAEVKTKKGAGRKVGRNVGRKVGKGGRDEERAVGWAAERGQFAGKLDSQWGG